MDQYGGKIIGGLIASLQGIILVAFGMLYNKVDKNDTEDVKRHLEVIKLINKIDGKFNLSLNDDVHHLRAFNELKAKVERIHP